MSGVAPETSYRVSDPMHSIEHSVEAKLPFLQHYNRGVEFVPILVPCMSFARMNELAPQLAPRSRRSCTRKACNGVPISPCSSSTDAVHYGDDGWGGRDFACLRRRTRKATPRRSRTSSESCAIASKASCGRTRSSALPAIRLPTTIIANTSGRGAGAIPFPSACSRAWHLQQLQGAPPLAGTVFGYTTSLDGQRIKRRGSRRHGRDCSGNASPLGRLRRGRSALTASHRTDRRPMLIHGRCHCGNIALELEWAGDPPEIPARACDCSFCTKHGGVWTSSPASRLAVVIRNAALVSKYTFGTRTATFHVCSRCGSVPLVTSEIADHLYAVVNVNVLEDIDPSWLRRAAAHFEDESVDSRLARRRRNWIPDVHMAQAGG